MLIPILVLLALVILYFRKNISKAMSFLGDTATGFSDEYNSAYAFDDDDCDNAIDKNSTKTD